MKNTLINITLPIYRDALLDELQPTIRKLLGQNNFNHLMLVIDFARNQGADIRLIWHYSPYKKNEYCPCYKSSNNVKRSNELKIYQNLLSDFIKMRRLENILEVVQFTDAYPSEGLKKTNLLQAITDHRLFGDLGAALKLCSRFYDRKKYTNLITLDCLSLTEQIINKLSRFNNDDNNVLHIKAPSLQVNSYINTDKKLKCLKYTFDFMHYYIKKRDQQKPTGNEECCLYLVDGVVDLLLSLYSCYEHKLIKITHVKKCEAEIVNFLESVTCQYDQKTNISEIYEIERELSNYLKDMQYNLLSNDSNPKNNFITEKVEQIRAERRV